jgi:hypothetical protein
VTKEKFLEEIDWIYEQLDKSKSQEADYADFEWRLSQLTLNYKTGNSFSWRNDKN